MTKDDSIWKPLCLEKDPNIQNPDNLPWKHIYDYEVNLKKFGKCNPMCASYKVSVCDLNKNISIDVNSEWDRIKNISIDVDLGHKDLTGAIFKKLILKKCNLKCPLEDVILGVPSAVIKDEDNLKEFVERYYSSVYQATISFYLKHK